MKTIVRYQCETCKSEYNHAVSAAECELRKDPARFAVGDIVLARSGFGWYDGDRAWISNPEVEPMSHPCPNTGHDSCFSPCCTYAFYYVVTAIDADERDGHRTRYHLETLAMSGAEGYRRGYTFNEGHGGVTKVENPPAIVVEQSWTLIGNKAKTLI